ncbi:aspartate/glutamate racemase family protein [Ruegeria sp. 2012CJ41-6]|uniref:Aspartate/glutamate racemase family protein n=1 Tax=Ruegeria spongiae TaxID=2942209 RepID=A0ABT0Q6F7_9RHOB|nr:aspartate/glutamate racemase family protein [Ruegeria spongiae]MCL6285471.1 aspartate/glutamate racemase family protein [Ruegeria spongiae]
MQTGGKTVFGASVGILMLETQFPRIPGDMGNAMTWPFPVQYRVVRGASPERIVRGDPCSRLDDFIDAGRELVAMGCDGITTNCGFLSLVQDDLRAALGVPVATSSLMQVPMVQAMLPPGQKPVILTISKATLTPQHLSAARVPLDTPIYGTDDGQVFTRDILGDASEIDFEACRQDMLQAADAIIAGEPQAGAIVLECTNMVPFAADIRRRTGLPVFSIYTMIQWFQASLMPHRFPSGIDDPRPGHQTD